MNSKRKKNLILKLSLLFVAILLLSIFLFTGCVRGMTPIGWSGANIVNGNLFTGSKEGRLVQVNLSNNALQFAEPLRSPSNGGAGCSSTGGAGSACGGAPPAVAIYGTPAVSGGNVYIAGYNGKVFAYNAASIQQIQWTFPVEGNLQPIISGITVSGDSLYFGGTDSKVYALSATAPVVKWEFTTGGEIWSTPVVANNTVYVSSFDKKVYALDAATGELKWEFATGATNVATPLVHDGIVYVGSLDRNLYALNEADGSLVWKFTGGNWFWATPVVAANDIIFAPCLDSRVYGLDAKTGALRVEYNVEGQVASSPVIVNEQIIVATQNSKLLALNSNPATPSQVLVANIPENVNAPLAAANDIVYINAPDNNIYSFNIVTGARFSPISLSTQ